MLSRHLRSKSTYSMVWKNRSDSLKQPPPHSLITHQSSIKKGQPQRHAGVYISTKIQETPPKCEFFVVQSSPVQFHAIPCNSDPIQCIHPSIPVGAPYMCVVLMCGDGYMRLRNLVPSFLTPRNASHLFQELGWREPAGLKREGYFLASLTSSILQQSTRDLSAHASIVSNNGPNASNALTLPPLLRITAPALAVLR